MCRECWLCLHVWDYLDPLLYDALLLGFVLCKSPVSAKHQCNTIDPDTLFCRSQGGFERKLGKNSSTNWLGDQYPLCNPVPTCFRDNAKSHRVARLLHQASTTEQLYPVRTRELYTRQRPHPQTSLHYIPPPNFHPQCPVTPAAHPPPTPPANAPPCSRAPPLSPSTPPP